MTKRQIQFAALHDWYVDRAIDCGAVLVCERFSDGTQEFFWFDDFRKLLMWAGY